MTFIEHPEAILDTVGQLQGRADLQQKKNSSRKIRLGYSVRTSVKILR